VWHVEGEENLSVQVVGAFTTNDGGAAHTLALEGAGIARKSIWDVGDDIAGGRLIRILSDFAIPAAPLNALYPNSRHLAPRVRALVHFLSERLGQMRRWDAAMDKSGSSR
jgi:DNA-binding transcriptional LysR family regulator